MDDWTDIPSQPGYQVTSCGRVRSVDREVVTVSGREKVSHRRIYRGQELKPGRMPSGHLSVACGKGNSRCVHVLVLETFVGPCPEGMEALHLNDVPSDNRLQNLRWGTRSENVKMAYANGCR